MLPGAEAAGIGGLLGAIPAEEEATAEIGSPGHGRDLVDRKPLPRPFAQLALRLRPAGEILAEGVQRRETLRVFLFSSGHGGDGTHPIDAAPSRKHLLAGCMGTARFLFLLLVSLGTGLRAEDPPVGTFSIVAADPSTGEIGVAVQSRIVAVGGIVPFARAGVGAVATQAYANVRYGPAGLAALAAGIAPDECLRLLAASDPLRERRQAGLVDASGRAATYTGNDCLGWAGGVVGDHFAVQGNILAGRQVVEAMAEAFEQSEGTLAQRLIASLKAGQAAGGDKRGMQSAALLVVRKGWGYGGLDDRYRDLRVDEHPDPIAELERIHRAHRRLFPRPDDTSPETAEEP